MPAVLELEKKKILTNGEKKEFKAKIRQLRSLLNVDKKDQSETFVYLKRALDEDRLHSCQSAPLDATFPVLLP